MVDFSNGFHCPECFHKTKPLGVRCVCKNKWLYPDIPEVNIVIPAKPAATGLRYNEGKNPLELLDPLALEGLARVLEFGARKYAAHNWRGGLKYSSVIGCLLRHLFAIMKGELIDKESGLPHIDHVGCNWMFLSYLMKTRPDLDDLWKDPQRKEK